MLLRLQPRLCQHTTRPNPYHSSIVVVSLARRQYATTLYHGKNYYEILEVPPSASAAEIKKKFYALSLAYHPDRNRSDPTASERFATISAAYHVLSNPFQRARYDREHGIHSTAHTNRDMHQRGGSGATGRSYMGSRPASGLSQRRGPFKGPPPSFYAHGGYGAYTARGDQRKGAAGYERRDGDDPTSFVRDNPVSHFNAGAHFRTQAAEDQRRRERKLRAMGIDENSARDAGSVFLARFTIVTGILLGGIFVGSLFREGVMVERRKDQKM